MTHKIREIHDNDYIHRDLKPENIMFTKQGVVKVIDFGWVKRLQPSGKTSTWIGTPLFMCPEIAKEKLYGKESDIWSLGVILYYMILKEYPVDSEKG